MAFHLIHADGRALLASDRPLLRAAERQPVEDAVALLGQVRDWHDREQAALADVRAAAVEQGRADGEADGRAAFAAAIATLTAQAQAEAERRDSDVAALALAALRQMVGGLADEERMAGIARRAVEALGSRGPVTVEVSQAMCGPVEQAFADLPSSVEVSVRGQEGLANDQCRLTAPDGWIIADLDVQIQSVAKRWEVADAG